MSLESDDIENEPWRTVEYGNLALVQAIKKRPCLYNTNIPEYSQKDVTKAAWEEIAEEFNTTVVECKKRWKSLRVVYRREIMKGNKKKKPYYLAKYMHFLRPFVQLDSLRTYRTLFKAMSKNNYSSLEVPSRNDSVAVKNFAHNEISEAMNSEETTNNTDDMQVELASSKVELNNSEPVVSYASYSPSKDNKNYSQINVENPRRQFISSLLPEVEEMTEKQFRNFKRKMLHLIDDIILESQE